MGTEPASQDKQQQEQRKEPGWQVTAAPCFRTGGSVMVPPQTKEKIKRRIKLHRYKEETVEELSVERAPLLPSFVMEETDTVEVSEVAQVCNQVPEAVLQDVRQLSPPPPPPRKQQCQKHSRCHCDLLSLGTSNFYKVSP